LTPTISNPPLPRVRHGPAQIGDAEGEVVQAACRLAREEAVEEGRAVERLEQLDLPPPA